MIEQTSFICHSEGILFRARKSSQFVKRFLLNDSHFFCHSGGILFSAWKSFQSVKSFLLNDSHFFVIQEESFSVLGSLSSP